MSDACGSLRRMTQHERRAETLASAAQALDGLSRECDELGVRTATLGRRVRHLERQLGWWERWFAIPPMARLLSKAVVLGAVLYGLIALALKLAE